MGGHKTTGIIWDWVPLVSVGPIGFDVPAQPLIKAHDLKKVDEYSVEGTDESWSVYALPVGGTRIYVGDKKQQIESVGCNDDLIYRGRSLFGLTLDEIRSILGPEDEIGEELCDPPQIPVEFEEYSLQLWFQDGVVISGSVQGPIEEDEE